MDAQDLFGVGMALIVNSIVIFILGTTIAGLISEEISKSIKIFIVFLGAMFWVGMNTVIIAVRLGSR